jgi:hypothetical protein
MDGLSIHEEGFFKYGCVGSMIENVYEWMYGWILILKLIRSAAG